MEVGRQHAPPPANRAVRNGKIGVQLRRFYEPKMKGKLTRGCAPQKLPGKEPCVETYREWYGYLPSPRGRYRTHKIFPHIPRQ